MKWVRRVDPYLILLFGLSLFALAPLAAPGYFYSAHDGRHSVFYLIQFDAAIRDGALWPRWAMHHIQGYGYPTFIIQAPLAFYVAELFVLLGAGMTAAVKLAWALGTLLSGWGMYALVRRWVMQSAPANPEANLMRRASLAGLVAGLLYVYAPYHLLDIYVRAAYAEFMLMLWFPWVFLAFDRLIDLGLDRGWQGWLALAAFSFAGLLLTHVFSLLAFTPLLMGFIFFKLGVVLWRGKAGARGRGSFVGRTLLAGAAGAAGILLTAVFVIPLLLEGPLLDQAVYVRETYDFTRHFVFLGQFFNPFWGYGFSDDPTGVNDGMSFQVGAMLLALLLTAAITLWRAQSRRLLMGFLLAATAAILFTMTPAATWIWATVPMMEVIQFPWRLLALSSFTAAALGGLVVFHLLPEDGTDLGSAYRGPVLILALLVIFAVLPFTHPGAQEPIEPWREDGRAIFQFETAHPDMIAFTSWVKEPFVTSPMTPDYAAENYSAATLSRLGILSGQGKVTAVYSRGSSFGGAVDMSTPGVVQIRTYYFPGFRAKVDGQPVDLRVSDPNGLMEVDVPAGPHTIDVRMGTTPARTAGTLISWATALGLVGLWAWSRRRSPNP